MAGFARMVGGAWRVTFASGTSAVHTWRWGPGQRSLRKTDGWAADGDPWGGEVIYWHPGRRQVRLLTMHGDIPGVGRGVGEGSIRFDGEASEAVVDLYQPRGLRKLGQRQAFDGPDEYHETLLEDGGAGLQPLAEWDFFRTQDHPRARPSTDARALLECPEHLKVFEALVGSRWEATYDSPTGHDVHIESTYEWVPTLEAVYARVVAPRKDGEPTHLLDAYFFRHVGTGALRCLALSERGGVYEGEWSVRDGGALQLDLEGFEGDRVVSQVVRFDFEEDGTARSRVWALGNAERTLLFDVRHERVEPEKD